MTRIDKVVVVIPARNEEALLPGCLEALSVAARGSPVPVQTIVVLDSCSDGTAAICAHAPVATVEGAYGNVGLARHAGIVTAVRSRHLAQSVWIANTDADSRVAPDWLHEQVRLANDGADLVLGLANVSFDISASVLRAHQSGYLRRIRTDGSHNHVHGASFGIRASTYFEAGGFPPLTDHEDRQLVLRVRALRYPVVVTTTSLTVETSGRTDGRCQAGVAHSIAQLTSAAAG